MNEPEPSSSLESEEECTPPATVTSERTTVKPPCDQQQPGAVSELFSFLVSWNELTSHQEWPNCQAS